MYNRKKVAEITGIPFRRVLFWTETLKIFSHLEKPGRGVPRKYSWTDIENFYAIKKLQDFGLRLEICDRLVRQFRNSGNKKNIAKQNEYSSIVCNFEAILGNIK